jgi:hypothetical protein
MIPFEQDDGGRAAAGFRGSTGDCVTRAIAIAAQRDYREVYDALHEAALTDQRYMRKLERRYGERARAHASPRDGVSKQIYKPYLAALGFEWTPTMHIGSGCRVHVRADELPATGRYVLNLSGHLAAWVDGVLRDLSDCSRGGTRCVYGYWRAP